MSDERARLNHKCRHWAADIARVLDLMLDDAEAESVARRQRWVLRSLDGLRRDVVARMELDGLDDHLDDGWYHF